MNTPSFVLDSLPQLLAFGLPGNTEWIILLILGLLIFGRRLPEVGRWLGQGIVEFKKGIKGVSEEIDEQAAPKPRTPERLTDQAREREQAPAAKATHSSEHS
ncbi:MAG TPA: twin-arginine translocase TatA/TatE family subunit [Phycisphaerales bacterium]|nr:twin-arginine translocase TatA/TatE family subunit [Phycisphaerales bacterium]